MTTKRKILIVDDDQDFRNALRKILEKNGYAVVEAKNGQEGLRATADEKPDAIIIDIVMDTFSEGFDFIARLVRDEQLSGIPRIIISSLSLMQQVDAVGPEELGTVEVLQKPVQAGDLVSVIENAIRTRHEKG